MSEIYEQAAAASSAPSALTGNASGTDHIAAASVSVDTRDSDMSGVVVLDMFEPDKEPGGCVMYCCVEKCITVPLCAPIWPFVIVDALLGCCGMGCGCAAGLGDKKQSVTFDYTNRVVILREFTRFYCLSNFVLVKEQRLHFDVIDSFKCAKSEKWIDASGHALLVAVKRPLGEQCDGGLPQSTASQSAAAAHGPPYQWPAFVDRSIFEGGDLLPLDFISAASRNLRSTLPQSDDVYAKESMQVCDDIEKLLPVVQDLNARLGASC
jgi:hypothetical protein